MATRVPLLSQGTSLLYHVLWTIKTAVYIFKRDNFLFNVVVWSLSRHKYQEEKSVWFFCLFLIYPALNPPLGC